MRAMEDKTISIVIPVYNEAENLIPLYEELCGAFEGRGVKILEIIFADDASTDGSPGILEKLKAGDPRVRVILSGKNRGRTNMLYLGFMAASGALTLTIDADRQLFAGDLAEAVKWLNGYDAVLSYRTNRLEADGFMRFASSRVANFLRNLFLGEKFPDSGSSLCGYKTAYLKRLTLYDDLDVFIGSLLKAAGCRIKLMPVRTRPRQYGRSNYGIYNRALRKLAALFAVAWMKKNTLAPGSDGPEKRGDVF